MNTTKKMVLAIAAAAAAFLLYVVWPQPKLAEREVKPIVSSKQNDSASLKSAAETPKLNAIQKNLTAFKDTPTLRLARLYQNTTDKRKFFDLARQHPEDGGTYLAGIVVLECMMYSGPTNSNAREMQKWIDEVPSTDENKTEHIAAIKKIFEPCLGFDTAPVSVKEIRLKPRVGPETDPVIKVQLSLDEKYAPNGDLAGVSAVLGEAVNSGNPYAIDMALKLIGEATQNYNKFSNFVNGVELSPLDAKAFMEATKLVACQFGVDCSQNSMGLLLTCAQGPCNLDAYQLSQLLTSPEQYASTVRFHNLIVDALQNGNFDIIRLEKRTWKK